MGPRALALLLALTAGCTSEYHPEYSPRSSYSVTQNVSFSSAFEDSVLASRREPVVTRPPPAPPHEVAPSVAERGAPRPAEASIAVAPTPAPAPTPTFVADRGDLTRCRAGRRASCRDLPGVHINGNVQINGNVEIFGNVFINDDH
jgi:hypothetical protein